MRWMDRRVYYGERQTSTVGRVLLRNMMKTLTNSVTAMKIRSKSRFQRQITSQWFIIHKFAMVSQSIRDERYPHPPRVAVRFPFFVPG